MHRFPALVRALGVGAAFAVVAGFAPTAFAASDGTDVPIMRPLHKKAASAGLSYGTSALGDTIYVGYKSSSTDVEGVGTSYTGLPGDGVWDWDTDIAGTDSSQFWHGVTIAYNADATADRYPTPESRPFWYFDHGNETNYGNTGLWLAREAAGRTFKRTGAVTIWHVDNMAGVSSPIGGSSSAWCGLRATGDNSVIDPVTGNALNADITYEWNFGGAGSWSSFPGYSDQWDQILYRDVNVPTAGASTVSFDYRTDLSTNISTELGGTGWFNPDPTAAGNFVLNPADSLMVWAGRPTESAYDSNRRWLSEVLDFGSAQQPAKLVAYTGTGSGNSGALTIPASLGTGTIRIAFQVKTNRTYSDETNFLTGFDSVDGAAVIDNVAITGLATSTFESATDIRPRVVHTGGGGSSTNSASASWIATGKPPAAYGHVHNAYALTLVDDPCGPLGDPNRLCTLDNNVAATSNHDDPSHRFVEESWAAFVGPTIDLTGPRAAAQGTGIIETDGFSLFRVQYDIYTGTMDLDQAVFWNIGAFYSGSAFTVQAVDDPVQTWSPGLVVPAIIFNPDPACATFSTDTDLDGIIPTILDGGGSFQVDSLRLHYWTQTRCKRFAATLCGEPQGGVFDNIQATFTGGEGAAITAQFWHLFQDTYTVNAGGEAFGSAAFDTTTALVKSGLNNAPTNDPDAGVSPGDSSVVNASFGTDTRLDLVFRIKPGPGNYVIPGDVGSGLVDKGGYGFWAAYIADPGLVGAGTHAGGVWDPNTWNSARMDSADVGNIAALVGRQLGVPNPDQWSSTYHEGDPKYGPLGVSRNRCFLVDPAGQANDTNICCSSTACTSPPFSDTWPPAAYPVADWASTTTIEGTKILPDGQFTPGTSVEYLYRRSSAAAPFTGVSISPDTTVASSQTAFGPHSDGQRFMEFAVFPDRWKATTYGGLGDACMLVIDGGDRRGQEQTIAVALDALGYGDMAAGRGWDQPNLGALDQNNPANHVSANGGHKGSGGLHDWYDIGASESAEAGRPGCRLASQTTMPPGKGCFQGPSEAVLADAYSVVLWFADDLESGVFHDGADNQEQSRDVTLLDNWLLGAGLGTERAAWIAADGAANDLASSVDLGGSLSLLSVTFGASLVAESYRDVSGQLVSPSVYDPTGAAFNPAAEYGYNNFCLLVPDVLDISGVGAEAARYEDVSHRGNGGAGPYVASVYGAANPGAAKYHATLISGHQVPSILGDTPAAGGDVIGRLRFVDDALKAFNLCVSAGAPVQVGNTPGLNVNFVRGAFPNPAPMNRASISYSLAQPAKVTIRFYNVAGRLVHELEHDGVAGPNTVTWNGATSTGMRASAGVYFYRLAAPGIEFQNNNQRMVLLGANR